MEEKINTFQAIVSWCNDNQGFISAILTIMSLVLSGIAIYIAIKTNKTSVQVGVFGFRHEIYTEIERIYGICQCLVDNGKKGNYISKRFLACSLLYEVNTKEYEACRKMLEIEKEIQACSEEDWIRKRSLESDMIQLTDQLVPDIERENQRIRKIKSGFYLMYPEKYHQMVGELLDEYELFYITHFAYNDEEFDKIIEKMEGIVNALEDMDFGTMMVRHTLKRKL